MFRLILTTALISQTMGIHTNGEPFINYVEDYYRVVCPMEIPVVGETLCTVYDEYGELTKPYADKNIEQCTGYVRGRFEEFHNVYLPTLGNAKLWILNHNRISNINVIYDVEQINHGAIAVFEPTIEYADMPGHVVFIEYVERDILGQVKNIYYSDANGLPDIEFDVYNHGVDGVAQMKSVFDFENQYGLKLVGYLSL